MTTASSPEVDAVFRLARAKLPAALETKFAEFPVAMLDTHGKDLQVSGTPGGSGTSTPVPAAPAASASSVPAPAAPKAAPKRVNTSTVKTSATFMAAADDLFSLLTDAQRIPSWTRAQAVSEAKVGSEYALFGGGVKGKYLELDPPKRIVQSWALQNPSWPSGKLVSSCARYII